MRVSELKSAVQNIVKEAARLKDKHTAEKTAHVNYTCIFSQDQREYESLIEAVRQLGGKVRRETPTGPLFEIAPLTTESGKLRLLKIRIPDRTRPERGDADFTVADYGSFKGKYLSKPGFKLIERPEMEMIELMDGAFNVRAYFSNPPLDKQLGLA